LVLVEHGLHRGEGIPRFRQSPRLPECNEACLHSRHAMDDGSPRPVVLPFRSD
jgi:hypothetical protein